MRAVESLQPILVTLFDIFVRATSLTISLRDVDRVVCWPSRSGLPSRNWSNGVRASLVKVKVNQSSRAAIAVFYGQIAYVDRPKPVVFDVGAVGITSEHEIGSSSRQFVTFSHYKC